MPTLANEIIVGIVIAAVAFVVAMAISCWYLRRKHRRHLSATVKEVEEGMAMRVLGEQIFKEDIELLNVIGRGSYGIVYVGRFRGSRVAVKKLLRLSLPLDNRVLDDFNREAQVMASLRHPNVVLFMGACIAPPDLMIITELMNKGSLHEVLLNDEVELPMVLRLGMMRDVCNGMTYLHAHKPPFLHRDLKSPNLLVDDNLTIKVSDFGLTDLMQPKQVDEKSEASGLGLSSSAPNVIGSLFWNAPEIMRSEPHTTKTDAYAFGIVMWEIVTRTELYRNQNPLSVAYRVLRQNLRPTIPTETYPELAELMERQWSSDPTNRLEFDQLGPRLESIQEHFRSSSSTLTVTQANIPRNAAHLNGIELILEERGTDQSEMCLVCVALPDFDMKSNREIFSAIELLTADFGGFEVSNSTDRIWLIFGDSESGLLFSAQLQLKSYSGELAASLNILDNDSSSASAAADQNESEMDSGSESERDEIKIAIHSGMMKRSLDIETRQVEYSGDATPIVLQLIAIAQPGQILTCNEFWNNIDRNTVSEKHNLVCARVERQDLSFGVWQIHHRETVGMTELRNQSLMKNSHNNSHGAVPLKGEKKKHSMVGQWKIQSHELIMVESAQPDLNNAANSDLNSNLNQLHSKSKSKPFVLSEGILRGTHRVVVKRIVLSENLSRLSNSFWVKLKSEIALRMTINHPNLNEFYGVCSTPSDILIVSAFAERGTLEHVLFESEERLIFQTRHSIISDIARGMNYLHSLKPPVIHHQLSVRSCLVASDYTARIGNLLSSTRAFASAPPSTPTAFHSPSSASPLPSSVTIPHPLIATRQFNHSSPTIHPLAHASTGKRPRHTSGSSALRENHPRRLVRRNSHHLRHSESDTFSFLASTAPELIFSGLGTPSADSPLSPLSPSESLTPPLPLTPLTTTTAATTTSSTTASAAPPSTTTPATPPTTATSTATHSAIVTTASDVYSFGVVAWETLLRTRFIPTARITDPLHLFRLLEQPVEVPDHLAEPYSSLLRACLNRSVSERPTFERISPFLDAEGKRVTRVTFLSQGSVPSLSPSPPPCSPASRSPHTLASQLNELHYDHQQQGQSSSDDLLSPPVTSTLSRDDLPRLRSSSSFSSRRTLTRDNSTSPQGSLPLSPRTGSPAPSPSARAEEMINPPFSDNVRLSSLTSSHRDRLEVVQVLLGVPDADLKAVAVNTESDSDVSEPETVV